MSFGDILGQIMQQGMGGQTQTRGRFQTTAENLDQSGGGLASIFGQLQGALAGGGPGQGGGGFAEVAKSFLQKDQIGGLSGGQIGGIGALAGALLGGGLGGAAKGGTMAVLGTLAIGALRRAQESRAATAAEPAAIQPGEFEALTGPDAERTLLRAMISAAKADGQIDQAEMQKIIGKISDDQVTPEEKQFVIAEMNAPLDIAGLAAEARDPAQAAQIYAASLLAIDVDSDQERQYLQDLAAALKLDAATVQHLHSMTGVAA